MTTVVDAAACLLAGPASVTAATALSEGGESSEDKVLDLQQMWSSGPELVDYEAIYM